MNNTSREPLTHDERELAAMLSRLEPHGEPSPALDARILAASRAAVAAAPPQRSGPRWPVALGLAASVVCAVGIAWQLRPPGPAMVASEVPVQEEAFAPQPGAVMERAAPVRADEASAQAVSTGPATGDSASAAALSDAAPASAPASADPDRTAAPIAQTSSTDRNLQPAARALTPPRQAAARARRAEVATTSPPPTPPAPPAAMSAPSEAAAGAQAARAPDAAAFVADPESSRAASSLAAEAVAARAEPDTRRQASARGDVAQRSEARAARSADADARRDDLDRVEVTGSLMRRTDLQVPVAQDAQLQTKDWLERVRTRYGLGDEAAARQSLLLFVQDHPGETVPEDLEPLLE